MIYFYSLKQIKAIQKQRGVFKMAIRKENKNDVYYLDSKYCTAGMQFYPDVSSWCVSFNHRDFEGIANNFYKNFQKALNNFIEIIEDYEDYINLLLINDIKYYYDEDEKEFIKIKVVN